MKKTQKIRKDSIDQASTIEFLRDFDFLTTLTSEEKILYQKGDLERGKELMEEKYVRDNQNQPYSLSCNLDEFKKFGPGIYLMFKFLKFATIMFGVITIFAIISISILASNQSDITNTETNGFKNSLLRTTLGNATSDNINIVEAFDMIIILIISVSFVYWSQKQKKFVVECLKQNILVSYYTVVLRQLPQNYNEIDMKTYLQAKYGPITEIYTVRNFGQDILQYRQMTQIVQQYKIQKALHDLDQEQTLKSSKLARLFLYFKNGHYKIKQRVKTHQNYKFCFAFIQFQSSQHRDLLLDDSSKNFFQCIGDPNQIDFEDGLKTYKEIYSKQDLVFQECDMQPNGILWQNLHLSTTQKIFKTLLLFFFMLMILTLSIFLISSFSAIEMGVYNTIYSKMSRQKIIELSDEFAMLSYCLSLSLNQFSKQSDICEQFQTQYIKITYLVLLIPISISIFKFLLTELMKLLVSFRRYGYQIQKIQSQALILFVFYFLVTGVVQFIVYLSFGEESSFIEIFSPLIKAFLHPNFQTDKVLLTQDFTPAWYLLASINIIIIGAMSFNLSAFGIIFYCFIRRKICFFMAKKQQIQIQMNKWLAGYELQIQYIYASILTIIFFTLLFSSCIPILYPFAFLSFFIQYWVYKYIFIRFCCKPLVFNHSISKLCRKIMFLGLIMHCFIAPNFYLAPGIADLNEQLNFFQRFLRMWYYLLLISLLISYKVLRNPIKKIWGKYQRNKQKKEHQNDIFTKHGSDQLPPPPSLHKKHSLPPQLRKMSEHKPHQSYSIHNSPYLKNILLTLYTLNNRQRSRKTCLLNRQLFHLYEDSIKASDDEKEQFRTLFQVIKLVRRDFKVCERSKNYGKNPYENLKRKLYEIYINCKGGKFSTYTINQINYSYDQMDYVCQKYEKQSECKTNSIITYQKYIEEENRRSRPLQAVAQQQNQDTTDKKNQKYKDEDDKQAGMLPQISQKRLVSGQSI